MQRIHITPRPDKESKLESIGLSFHSWDNYWNEEVCYSFSMNQIDAIEEETNELHQMCMVAVKYVIDNGRLGEMGIPIGFHQAIADSFADKDFTLYGRFDLAYDGLNSPKMLEYNADTPTSLLEAAVAQWYWFEEKFPGNDQFNSLHERLVARWREFQSKTKIIYFASLADNEEDWVCVHYLMETAIQAGFDARHIYIEDIGWNEEDKIFVDLDYNPIDSIFKLYPWEWMFKEDFGAHVPLSRTKFIEPMWKAILSNKAILPILWELYPNNKYLLPAYFTQNGLESYAKKPFFSREGSGIELYKHGSMIADDAGPYGAEGYIYQQLVDLPVFEGKYPVIGSWIIGNEAGGMAIREDDKKITTNMSQFIPHYIQL